MNNLTKNEIKEIVKKYHFEIDDKFIELIYNDFNNFVCELEYLKKIDITNVTPTHYCINDSCNTLRKDEPIIENNPDEFLKNSKNKIDRYVVVK